MRFDAKGGVLSVVDEEEGQRLTGGGEGESCRSSRS